MSDFTTIDKIRNENISQLLKGSMDLEQSKKAWLKWMGNFLHRPITGSMI